MLSGQNKVNMFLSKPTIFLYIKIINKTIENHQVVYIKFTQSNQIKGSIEQFKVGKQENIICSCPFSRLRSSWMVKYGSAMVRAMHWHP